MPVEILARKYTKPMNLYKCILKIDILAPLQIINFLEEWLGIPCYKHQEKDIENLFKLTFCGKNSLNLYNKIYKGVGLKRKWDKIVPFLNKKMA